MSKFLVQYKRELAAFFRSPLAYVVLACFLLLSGFNFHFAISALNLTPSRLPLVEAFFNTVLFWFPLLLICPLLTMRLFAEERRLGTLETLLTAPVRDGQIVLAKYFAALSFYVVLWAPTALYFVIFHAHTRHAGTGALGPYVGAYLMVLLLGMFYLAVGCLCSALTKHQLAAGAMSFAAVGLLFFLGLATFLMPNVSPELRAVSSYFSAVEHMGDFSRGLFDTRPVVWYVSMTALALYLTFQVFQSRKWRGA